MVSINLRYQDSLRDLLIQAGVVGMRQSDITVKMLKVADSDMIVAELERLRKRGAVQKFKYRKRIGDKGGPSITVWRATTAIYDG